VAFPRPRCSRVAQPTPRPPEPAEAAARRHRSRSSRFKARRAPYCCAEARCVELAVPKGRRRKPGPLSVRATPVAHSPCHRSCALHGPLLVAICPSSRDPSQAAHCCAEASRTVITASEGRRNGLCPPFGPRAALVLLSPRHGRLSSPGNARCHRPRPAGAKAAELPAAACCCSLLLRMTSSSISNWAPAPRRCCPPHGAPRRRAPRRRLRRTHRPGPRTCPGRLRATRRARAGARRPQPRRCRAGGPGPTAARQP